MRILITGSTGSIGRELTKVLAYKGHDLALIVRDVHKANDLFASIGDQHMLIIDYNKAYWTDQISDFSPEIVIHLAALLTSRDDQEIISDLIASNITFGTELLQALRRTRIKLFINTGTFAEYFYGDGQFNSAYLYSATKTAFHSIIKYYQQLVMFPVVNAVPYTVYGQVDIRPKIIDIIYSSFFEEEPTNMSGGLQTLDFIHIIDVVNFYCLLVERTQVEKDTWDDYHLGTGQGRTLKQVAQLLSTKLGRRENTNWGALPYRPRDTMYSVAPIAKMLNHFSWKPTIDLESGIDRFLASK